ncbi:MAG: hypothetical protein GX361_02315 [Bacteroidales bacterium]|nr:hypothetical protein [Bacteroidales bacterium]
MDADTNSTIIEKEIDNLVFKFCLLNEKGEPATVFKEGENFTFNFSIQNFYRNPISVPTHFVNNDFYRVYKKDNTDMGKPWAGIWCEFSLTPQEITIAPNEIRLLNCPWRLTESNQPDYPLCMNESRNILSKGDYYTSINTQFDYVVNSKNQSVKLNLRINFKIQ